jgi:hypothetical protein
MIRTTIIVAAVACMLLVASCGSGGPYGEAKALISEQVGIMNTLVNNMDKAGSATDVANAFKAYNDAMERLAPRLKDFAKRNTELAKAEEIPAELTEEMKKLQEVSIRMGEVSTKSAQFMSDPEVSKEIDRMMKIMSDKE